MTTLLIFAILKVIQKLPILVADLHLGFCLILKCLYHLIGLKKLYNWAEIFIIQNYILEAESESSKGHSKENLESNLYFPPPPAYNNKETCEGLQHFYNVLEQIDVDSLFSYRHDKEMKIPFRTLSRWILH